VPTPRAAATLGLEKGARAHQCLGGPRAGRMPRSHPWTPHARCRPRAADLSAVEIGLITGMPRGRAHPPEVTRANGGPHRGQHQLASLTGDDQTFTHGKQHRLVMLVITAGSSPRVCRCTRSAISSDPAVPTVRATSVGAATGTSTVTTRNKRWSLRWGMTQAVTQRADRVDGRTTRCRYLSPPGEPGRPACR
jgi:hypothetical protein